MAQLLITGIGPDVVERLRERAELNGTSAEAEALTILSEALVSNDASEEGFGTQFRRYFDGIGLDFELPDFADDGVEPVEFTR